MLAALQSSEAVEENTPLEDDSGETEADALSEAWELDGRVTVTPLWLDSLFFDLKALASSFVCVFCSDLFLRVVCQWFFISLSVLPGNSAAIADHLRPTES